MKKKIKLVLLGLTGTGLLLFCALVIHIALVKPPENATIQISRIDFEKPFDSIGAVEIRQKIESIPGVKKDVLVKKNVVVYFHDNRIADSKKVFAELMQKGDYKAQRFEVNTALSSKQVCPAMKKEGFYYELSKIVHQYI
ncbi:hypothetical protein KIH23_09950 [Flavobacterium sp. CYK-55]|uniref:hypothetical protein n=1 Tax=Flavobacterium sp. CYK-55 TaxID=2835529 RepID=UPI001BCFCFCA|nr:hypothetical protein [Flavobacterium sp. CYK-55]MBS7787619.1 hypothetical protein [Flavobacterium sp. CYK-55]